MPFNPQIEQGIGRTGIKPDYRRGLVGGQNSDVGDPSEIEQIIGGCVTQAGGLSESDMVDLLKSPRRVRAFARHFDSLVALVPFAVEIETIGVMKRYKKKSG